MAADWELFRSIKRHFELCWKPFGVSTHSLQPFTVGDRKGIGWKRVEVVKIKASCCYVLQCRFFNKTPFLLWLYLNKFILL